MVIGVVNCASVVKCSIPAVNIFFINILYIYVDCPDSVPGLVLKGLVWSRFFGHILMERQPDWSQNSSESKNQDRRPIKPVQNRLKPVQTENRKNRSRPVKTSRIPKYFVGMNCSLIYYLDFKPLIVKNRQELNIICYFL